MTTATEDGFDFRTQYTRRGTNSIKWDLVPQERLPLWVADMDFAPPPVVLQAVRERLEHPILGYSIVPPGFYDALDAFQREQHRRPMPRDEVTVISAVMPGVKTAIECFSRPGDGVVIQTPVYTPFFHSIENKGRRVIVNHLHEHHGEYRIDFEELESVIDSETRIMLLCSPHNPVGRVWTRHELESLAEIALRHDLTVVSDEIHADLRLNDNDFLGIADLGPEIAARTVTIVSPSKTFNIPGCSVAAVSIKDPELRARYRAALKAAGTDHVTAPALVASEAAYRDGGPWLTALRRHLVETVEEVRGIIAEGLPLVSSSPTEASFIMWLDFRRLQRKRDISDDELQRVLREEAKVELSHGPVFGPGGEGFQRLNIATPKAVLHDALARIVAALG